MNSKKSLGIFKFLAGFVSVYHFILGLVGTFASTDTVVWFVNRVYGVNPTIDAQFIYLAKFISIYMIVFAIAMAFLAWKPVKFRKLVWLPITLFSVRIIERLVFFDILNEAFGVDMTQNLTVIMPIGILVIALYTLRPKKN